MSIHQYLQNSKDPNEQNPTEFSTILPVEQSHRQRFNPATIPTELKNYSRWILYRLIPEPSGKFKKVPVDRHGNKTNALDLSNHMGFEEALRLQQQGVCDVLGFVLGPELKIVVIDLDDCRNPQTKELTPEAMEIIRAINSYTEVSLSGKGIHIFCHALTQGKRCKNAAAGVEIYKEARAIIVTGYLEPIASPLIEDRQTQIEALYDKLFPQEMPRSSIQKPQESVVSLEDGALLAKAESAKNGPKFKQLFEGKFHQAGFSSQSEADAALLGMLRFWSGGNKEQAFRLFERSGLNREKWQRDDYRDRTWEAIDSGDVYTPGSFLKAKQALDNVPADEDNRVLIPNGGRDTVPKSARKLAGLLGICGDVYNMSGEAVEYDGQIVRPLTPAKLAAIAQPECVDLRRSKFENDSIVEIPTVFTKRDAEIILSSPEFIKNLPKIKRILPNPGYVDFEGRDLCWCCGYSPVFEVYAKGEERPPPTGMYLETAKKLILGLTHDFRFLHKAERSRMIAMFLSPAFMLAGVLQGGRTPLFLLEAAESQTGKGYQARICFALYGVQVGAISQRKRGVGSMEESLHSKILNGDTFVYLDNLKRNLNSPEIESFATEDYLSCRVPHRAAVTADVRHVMMLLASNGMEVTPDQENRTVRIRIRKQPESYQYKEYAEGDLLAHVRAEQWTYYSAVSRILLEWHMQGRHRTAEKRHARREWAQVMDWVIQNIFHLPPLLEGIDETQARAINPRLEWLRSICHAVDRSEMMGDWITTTDLLAIMEDHDVSMFRARHDVHQDEDRRVQALGTCLAPLFRNPTRESVSVEEYDFHRLVEEPYPGRTSKKYAVMKQEDLHGES